MNSDVMASRTRTTLLPENMRTALFQIPLIVLLTGCGKETPPKSASLQAWEGSEVTVHFRRDVLGASGSPIAPTTTWQNQTKVSLDGKIIEARLDGVFFESHYKHNSGDTDLRHSVFWIPNASILTVESRQ